MNTYPESLRSIGRTEPRSLPFPVRVRLLFGGTVNQCGWLVFAFGMIFFWLFVWRADLTSWYRFRGPLKTVSGQVTESSETGASVGGTDEHRGTPVYRNEFSYMVDDKVYQGVSYATGSHLRVGSFATVEYRPDRPGVARIQGMRTEMFGPGVLFVAIFPLAGLGVLSFGLIRGMRACSLLACGVQTSAKLMTKEPTSVSVNNRPVFKFTFCFKTVEGELCTATIKTSLAVFEKEADERVIYDPRQPRRTLLPAMVPGSPCIGEDDRIVCERPASGWRSLAIPLATILGHGWWAVRLMK